jgi:hypothetical protein
MELNRANYHSIEAERDYMSRSQYQGWRKCEACQQAKLAGTWTEETSDAFLVGQYVHAWSEGSIKEWIAEHPGMFTKSGGLRSEYKTADKMIAMLEADPMIMYMLQGEKEVIFTAEFAGAMWKIMTDVYNPERKRMVELKTNRNLRETVWCPTQEKRVNFIEQYYYLTQAALYTEIERRASGRPEEDWWEYYMVAVSKENVPDKEIIDLRDPPRYAAELEGIERNMERILQVKAGTLEPFRCERCDYCRSTRMLTGAIHYSEL